MPIPVNPPQWLKAEPGDNYWSISSYLGYTDNLQKNTVAQYIQAVNSNKLIWPGTMIMIPDDLPVPVGTEPVEPPAPVEPPVVVEPPAPVEPPVASVEPNWASWWWSKNDSNWQDNLESFTVTSSADSGSGTLRDALSKDNRLITFSKEMEIKLTSQIVVGINNVIIDGKGLATVSHRAIKLEGTNIIVKNMNFKDALYNIDEDSLTIRNAKTTQVFQVTDCTFDKALDGGLDVIWNNGNDVYGYIANNSFKRINKVCLVHSGSDTREGGRYHITFRNNLWEDCIQRMPMARDADIHIDGDRYIKFGDHVGAGGGAKSSRNTKMYVENITAEAREVGQTTFDGLTVTKPRAEAVGPHLSTPKGAVKAINCPGAPTVIQSDANLVEKPPYLD